jgi:hypothetical protein
MKPTKEVLMIRIAPALLILCATLLAGCASDPAKRAEEQQEVAEEIEAILTQPLSEEEYVEGERCISTYQYDSVEVLDNQHVVFKGRGKKLWLNTLRARCVGLRRRDILQFELRGSQLCNLDDFVAIDYTMYFGMETSAKCVLGNFTSITEEQIALIKDAVEKKRN